MLASRPRALGALVPHIVAMDGVIIGGWRRTVDRRAIQIRLSLVRPLDAGERAALQRAADQYAAHLGDVPALVSGPASSASGSNKIFLPG